LNSAAALAGLLLTAFGPVDIDEQALDSPVATTLTLTNHSTQTMQAAFDFGASGWRTAAGRTTGEESLRPRQTVVLPGQGRLTRSLYPLPRVRTTWAGDNQPVETASPLLVRKLGEAQPARARVAVNGILSEECWLLGRRLGRFGSEFGERPCDPSPEWMAAYDATHLYFAVVCEEPRIHALVATGTKHDDPRLARDESVEFFLDCAGKRRDYFHLRVNVDGVVLDERCTLSAGGATTPPVTDRQWESLAKVAVQRGRTHYYMEVALPLKQLGVNPPRMGTVWLLNVARNRRVGDMTEPVRSLWNPSPGGCRNPEAFGALVFK